MYDEGLSTNQRFVPSLENGGDIDLTFSNSVLCKSTLFWMLINKATYVTRVIPSW